MEKKLHLTLVGCSLTQGVFLNLLPSLRIEEFIIGLKRFIARRGRPQLIYSDNGNLRRVPWWGGLFERLIRLFKNAFYKTIGNATLNWPELVELVLDLEITLNNRPLSYLENDVQQPQLTPNSMPRTLLE